MNRISDFGILFRVCAAAIIVSVAPSVSGGEAVEQRSGPDDIVIRLEYLPAAREPGTANDARTRLEISASRVVTVFDDTGRTEAQYQLQADELASLIDSMRSTGTFAMRAPTTLRSAIADAARRSGRSVPRGGDTVRLTLVIDDRSRQVECPQPSLMSARFPELTLVRQFETARLRLENVAAVTLAGGPAEVRSVLQLVNRRLSQQHPDQPPLADEHLTAVQSLPDGTRFLQFVRPVATETNRETVFAAVMLHPKTAPQVDVSVSERR